jgi:hypothetical protein
MAVTDSWLLSCLVCALAWVTVLVGLAVLRLIGSVPSASPARADAGAGFNPLLARMIRWLGWPRPSWSEGCGSLTAGRLATT